MNRAPWLTLLVLLVGCNQSDFETDPDAPDPDGPGTPQWGEEDVTCSGDSDCNFGESCTAGVCQMKRCAEDYESVAPFGDRRTFMHDREVIVADSTMSGGAYWADIYLPGTSSLTYPSNGGSWNGGTARITDLAGGAFATTGAEAVALARAGSSSVFIPAANKTVSVGFVPVAIAAGDIDHDGRDEVVAVSATAQLAICDVQLGSCTRRDFGSGNSAYDVTAGDVDRDGLDEVVVHAEAGGQRKLVVLNFDSELTGQPAWVEIASDAFMGVAAVDLDGDGRAEIVALTDGGWLGLFNDKLTTFTSNGSALARGPTVDVPSNSVDIAGGDVDRDGRGELVLLTSDRIAHVLRTTTLTQAYQSTLAASSAPDKITTADFDADSSVGRLVGQAQVVPGEVVPTTVMYMPPYYASMSDRSAYIYVGNSTTGEQSRTDSVGLSIGATFGVGGEIPGILGAHIGVELNTEATSSRTFAQSIMVTNRFEVEADPLLYGNNMAAVVVSCGCFQAYTYQLQSPVVGGNGEQFVVLLPVGGQTMLWSSKRYNAMATAVGNLPIIEVPYLVGDPRSYPTSPEHADGSPIAAGDLVFPQTASVRVSDIADVAWELRAGETTTNGQAMSTSLGVSASVTMAGMDLGGSIGLTWQQGYEVSVGSEVELGGMVPPIADDPNTPEDEYATYAYGFRPLVYREHYEKADGSSAAYYVVNYAVDF